MPLKTPKFWVKKNIISFALLLPSFIYCLGFFVKRFFTKTNKISKPVICIGNLIAGGAGKTPVALAIGKILHELNIEFAYLSRGYMSDQSKFLLLRKDHNYLATAAGDEPLLLAETAPTFLSRNRLLGARQINKMTEFKAIVLDDGMQNNSLHIDFLILVIDGKIGFGNNFMIPAGPLREPIQYGLKRADLIIVIGKASKKLLEILENKKIIYANIFAKNLHKFSKQKLIAFCGLAYPQKFFSYLENQSLEVIENISFADHYDYKNNDLEKLCNLAKEKNATLVTTKKDWVKFSPIFQKKISYLDIELEIENKEFVKRSLQKIL